MAATHKVAGRQGKSRRKNAAPVPPPDMSGSSSHGGVPLCADDLRLLAKNAGLTVTVNDPKRMAQLVRQVDDALHSFALFSRVDRKTYIRRDVSRWAASVQRWIADGIVILGGNAGAGSPGWLSIETRTDEAVALLMRGWPLPLFDQGEEAVRAALPSWFFLEAELQGARAISGPITNSPADWVHATPEDRATKSFCSSSYDGTAQLVSNLLFGLGALRLLANGTARHAHGLPATRNKNGSRREMMRQLAHLYPALHGEDYTVRNPNPASGAAVIPGGPALAWTRALFRLMADRAAAMPPEMMDKHSEFQGLAAWAAKPHAAADLIHPVRWWEAQRAVWEAAMGKRKKIGRAKIHTTDAASRQ